MKPPNVLLLLIWGYLLVLNCSCNELYVSQNGLDTNTCSNDAPCASVAGAISKADPISTIVLLQGIYSGISNTENVTWTTNAISFIGSGRVIIDGWNVFSGWNITSNDTLIQGIEFRNLYQGVNSNIFSFQSSVVTLVDCVFTGSVSMPLNGNVVPPSDIVSVSATNSVYVRNCTFSNNTADARIFSVVFPPLSSPLSSVTVLNSLFLNNTGVYGSALFVSSPVTTTVTINETVVRNTSTNTYYAYLDPLPSCFYLSTMGQITLSNCVMTENTLVSDEGGLVVIPQYVPSWILSSNFSNNLANIFMFNAWGVVSNCQFMNNSGRTSSFAVSSENQAIVQPLTFSNCLFLGNQSPNSGAAVVIQSVSLSVVFVDCKFIGNVAQSAGGAVSIFNHGVSSFTNCLFLDNSVTYSSGGGAVSYFGGALVLVDTESTIQNCIFQGNFAPYGGAFGCYECEPTITNSVFDSNVASDSGGAIQVVSTISMTLQNVSFSGNSVIRGVGGAIAVSNTVAEPVSVQKCLFVNNTADTGGALIVMGSATVSIESQTIFQGNSAISGGAIEAQGIVTVSNSTFLENYASERGGALEILGTVSVASCQFLSNRAFTMAGAMYVSGTADVSSSLFVNNTAATAGVASITQKAIGNFANTRFEHNSAQTSSLVQVQDGSLSVNGVTASDNTSPLGSVTVLGVSSVQIQTSAFIRNSAGSVFVLAGTVPVTIRDTSFLGNLGVFGASVLVQSSSANPMISNCVFNGNVAQKAGAGIYWETAANALSEISLNSTFVNNVANYGPATASSPLRIQYAQPISSPLSVIDSSVTLQLTVLDAYQQLVTLPTIYSLNVQLDEPASFGCQTVETVVTNFTAGYAQVSFSVPGVLHSAVNITFSPVQTTSIDLPPSTFGIIAGCSPGRTLGSSGCAICSDCEIGTYSVSINETCAVCPAGAACRSKYVWAETETFVLYNPSSQQMESYACPNCLSYCVNATDSYPGAQTACPVLSSPLQYLFNRNNTGSEHSGLVPTWTEGFNGCQEYTTGFMCAQCIEGYSEWSGKCTDCREPRYGLLALVLIGNALYIGFIHILMSGGDGSASALTLIDFYQTAQLVLPVEHINIIGEFAGLLNIQLPSGGTCLYERSFFGQFIQGLLLPVVSFAQMGLLILLLFLVQRCFLKQQFDTARWIYRPCLSLSLSVYTPITNTVFGMLRTNQVGEYLVLTNMPAIWTYTQSLGTSAVYYPYFVASVVIICFLTCGIPIALCVLLYRLHATKIWEEELVVRRCGSLYHIYAPNKRWWSVLILIRRTTLSALLTIRSSSSQRVAFAFATVLFLCLQLLIQPFRELLSNVGGMISLVSVTTMALVGTAFVMNFSPVEIYDLSVFLDTLQAATLLVLLGMVVWAQRETVKSLFMKVRNRLFARLNGLGKETSPINVDLEESLIAKAADTQDSEQL